MRMRIPLHPSIFAPLSQGFDMVDGNDAAPPAEPRQGHRCGARFWCRNFARTRAVRNGTGAVSWPGARETEGCLAFG